MAILTRREQLDIILDARLKDPNSVFTYAHFRKKFLQVFFNQEPIFPTWAQTCLTYLRAYHTFDLSEYQELLANKRYYGGRIHDANLPIREPVESFEYAEIDVRNAIFFMHLRHMQKLAEAKIKLSEDKIKAWDDDIKAIEQLTKVFYCSPQDLYDEGENQEVDPESNTES